MEKPLRSAGCAARKDETDERPPAVHDPIDRRLGLRGRDVVAVEPSIGMVKMVSALAADPKKFVCILLKQGFLSIPTYIKEEDSFRLSYLTALYAKDPYYK